VLLFWNKENTKILKEKERTNINNGLEEVFFFPLKKQETKRL